MNKLSILRSRNFRFLLLIRMCMMMALQAQAVIIGWQVYSLTGDVFMIGLVGLIEAVPAIACALVAGHIVDNGDAKRIYVACIGTMLLNALALLFFAGSYAHLPQPQLLILIFTGVFISGLARGFISPTSFTIMSRIVSKSDMPSAAAWMSSGFQTAAVTGPAVAGLIYGGYGPGGAWVIPALLIGFAFTLVCALKPPAGAARTEAREKAWKSIKAGWEYILKSQTLFSMMALDMFAVMFGGAVAMLPAYADQVLNVGPEAVGFLRASPAFGAIATALFFAVRPMRFMSARRLLFVVAGFGVCMMGLGVSTTVWFSALCLMAGGAFDSVSMIIRGTLMQLLTPDHMKGRLSSINSMFIVSSNEIGSFVQGTAARLLGLVPAIFFGAGMTLAIVAATATLAPRFRKTVIDTHEHK